MINYLRTFDGGGRLFALYAPNIDRLVSTSVILVRICVILPLRLAPTAPVYSAQAAIPVPMMVLVMIQARFAF